MIADATGFREAVVARAEGEAQRFTLLLAEYQQAPDVTRKRLYLETMQHVLSRNPRVFAGSEGNTLLLQMPSGTVAAPVAAAGCHARPAAAARDSGCGRGDRCRCGPPAASCRARCPPRRNPLTCASFPIS